MSSPTRSFVNVLGVRIDASTLEDATSRIGGWIAAGERTYVCVCSVNNVVEARRSTQYRQVLNASGLNTSDGMPLVWHLHRHGHPWARRVYGPDLVLAICQASRDTSWRHFYYGGSDGVAESFSARMAERFPGLKVAGSLSPPFARVDDLCTDEVAARINSSDADIVWVGLSTPKQEQWMARMRDRLEAPVLIGVGAAFDFHTNRLRQAPEWAQNRGLEWLFRLIQEPRRLWRRYLVGNIWFLWESVGQESGLKRFPLD
jgi:N-acetylglucosaminyldiphosphoundecaprenol N-acetyl-beta-D-mannosaminyltransferase